MGPKSQHQSAEETVWGTRALYRGFDRLEHEDLTGCGIRSNWPRLSLDWIETDHATIGETLGDHHRRSRLGHKKAGDQPRIKAV